MYLNKGTNIYQFDTQFTYSMKTCQILIESLDVNLYTHMLDYCVSNQVQWKETTWPCVHVRVCMHVQVCVHVWVGVYVHVRVFMHVQVCACVGCICACASVYACASVCVQVCYTYLTYILTCIHTYVCVHIILQGPQLDCSLLE